MRQVVTLTGVEVKSKGSNKRGPWALRIFDSAGGAKFQTFDVADGEALEAKIGTPVELTYEVEENGNFTNNVIKSFKSATEEQAKSAPTAADDPRRSKDEMRRTEAAIAASNLIGSPGWEGDADILTLATLADQIILYLEVGSSAFTPEEVVTY